MESWKPVVGYEGIYMVSNMGRIRSLDREDARGRKRKGKLLSIATSSNYPFVNLCRDRIPTVTRVHDIVAAAFLGPKPDGLTVNHLDGDKQNNRADNLAYVTQAENVHHAVKLGLVGTLSAEQVRSIRELFAANPRASYQRVATEYGVTKWVVMNIVKCKTYYLIPDTEGEPAKPTRRPHLLEDVCALLKRGYKMASIARILGVNQSAPYRAMNRAGIHFSRGDTLNDLSLRIEEKLANIGT